MHTPLFLSMAAKEKVFGSEICIFLAGNSFYNCNLNGSGPRFSSFTLPEKPPCFFTWPVAFNERVSRFDPK